MTTQKEGMEEKTSTSGKMGGMASEREPKSGTKSVLKNTTTGENASMNEGESENDPISFLEFQHREVEELFDQLEEMEEKDSSSRKEIIEQITHKLEVHSELEEKILYPAGRKADEQLMFESLEEHGLVKELCQKLKECQPTDETIMAKAKVLKTLVEHHVEEEEDEFFPAVREMMDEEKLREIGAQLKEEFKRLDAQPHLASHAKAS